MLPYIIRDISISLYKGNVTNDANHVTDKASHRDDPLDVKMSDVLKHGISISTL